MLTTFIVIALLALLMQVAATVYAWPLKEYVSRKTWTGLMLMNGLLILRRALSVYALTHFDRAEFFHLVIAIIDLALSTTMIAVVLRLRAYMLKERAKIVELARATLRVTRPTEQTNVACATNGSIAYKLAEYFISLKGPVNNTE